MSKNLQLLFVEDDPYLGTIVNDLLGLEGYQVQFFREAETAWEYFSQKGADICIFDVMLPGMDGFDLARKIRVLDKNVPILFLTAKSQKEDVIKGFQTGADDYLKKPFAMEELVLRIGALLRRSGGVIPEENEGSLFSFGKYLYDRQSAVIQYDGQRYTLTHRESEMLHIFCKNLNQLVERELILKKVWGDDSYFNARSMDVFLAKLRKHFRDDPKVSLVNIRGKGFKLLVTSSSPI